MTRFATRWGPALLLMLAIFLVSSRPRLFPAGTPGGMTIAQVSRIKLGLQKSGHIAVYAALAVFLLRGLRGSARLRPSLLAWAFLLTVIYGATDEVHQTYVPGRSGQVSDLVLDAIGASIGLTIRGLLLRARRPPAPQRSSDSI